MGRASIINKRFDFCGYTYSSLGASFITGWGIPNLNLKISAQNLKGNGSEYMALVLRDQQT